VTEPTNGLGLRDHELLHRAVRLALDAERSGNLPIAAVIALGDTIVAEAANAVLVPAFHPGRHAEVRALEAVPEVLWLRAADLGCYTTLEPCVMCFGALIAHGVGRVVFGSADPRSGGTGLVGQLPEYVAAKARAITWLGPVLPAVCDELRDRAFERSQAMRRLRRESASGR
jgi:tRNA(adenine34) deaminase